MREIPKDISIDHAIECVGGDGSQKAIQQIIDLINPEGTISILGVSEYPKSYWRTSRKAWSRIDYLSVREKTGADIISKVCDNNIHAEVVVDPTYLISCED